jgi:hypothetical protein
MGNSLGGRGHYSNFMVLNEMEADCVMAVRCTGEAPISYERIGRKEGEGHCLPPFGRRYLCALEVGEAFSNSATRCCAEDGVAGEGPSTISVGLIFRP